MIRNNNSMFIVVDGPRGAGKTTMIKRLENDFENGKLPFSNIITTREPGGTKMGEHIRKLFDTQCSETRNIIHVGMDSTTEVLLLNAARRHHLNHCIMPALDVDNTLVVCDRYLPSTFAYQSTRGGLHQDNIFIPHNTICYGFNPDFTIIIDVDISVSKKRIESRGDTLMGLSDSDLVLVRKGYRYFISIAERYGYHDCYPINGMQDETRVYEDIIKTLKTPFRMVEQKRGIPTSNKNVKGNILRFLSDYQTRKTAEITKAVECSKSSVCIALRQLVETGEVIRVKHGTYRRNQYKGN